MKMTAIQDEKGEHLFWIDFVPSVGLRIKSEVHGKVYRVTDVLVIYREDQFGAKVGHPVATVEEISS